ncbi:MAG: DUF805 domain-containing protein [Daejeonella sp.]
MFIKPFSFTGRIGRREYCLSVLICIIYIYLIAGINAPFAQLILFFPILYFFLAQGAKRCHDLGKSGWFQVITFYWIWMLFSAGTSVANELEKEPQERELERIDM